MKLESGGCKMGKLLTLADPPSEGRPSRYIEPASVADVLFDQLTWLIEHANTSCPPGCPHCARLDRVKNLLLAPFQALTDPRSAPESIAA